MPITPSLKKDRNMSKKNCNLKIQFLKTHLSSNRKKIHFGRRTLPHLISDTRRRGKSMLLSCRRSKRFLTRTTLPPMTSSQGTNSSFSMWKMRTHFSLIRNSSTRAPYLVHPGYNARRKSPILRIREILSPNMIRVGSFDPLEKIINNL